MSDRRAEQDLILAIQEGRKNAKVRSLITKIEVPVERFRLIDVLHDYSTYPTWNEFLDKEIRSACERYFADGETLIRELLEKKSSTKSTAS